MDVSTYAAMSTQNKALLIISEHTVKLGVNVSLTWNVTVLRLFLK
jgi:hypothetical protein